MIHKLFVFTKNKEFIIFVNGIHIMSFGWSTENWTAIDMGISEEFPNGELELETPEGISNISAKNDNYYYYDKELSFEEYENPDWNKMKESGFLTQTFPKHNYSEN